MTWLDPRTKEIRKCRICGRFFRPLYTARRGWYCSVLCRQRGNARLSANKRGKTLRGVPTKHGLHRYTKRNGRHEHRVVMELKLGRRLHRNEIVHHINGDGHDNRPKNLQLLTRREHILQHFPEMYEAKYGKSYERN